jgi:hypothetical protein
LRGFVREDVSIVFDDLLQTSTPLSFKIDPMPCAVVVGSDPKDNP